MLARKIPATVAMKGRSVRRGWVGRMPPKIQAAVSASVKKTRGVNGSKTMVRLPKITRSAASFTVGLRRCRYDVIRRALPDALPQRDRDAHVPRRERLRLTGSLRPSGDRDTCGGAERVATRDLRARVGRARSRPRYRLS